MVALFWCFAKHLDLASVMDSDGWVGMFMVLLPDLYVIIKLSLSLFPKSCSSVLIAPSSVLTFMGICHTMVPVFFTS